jgi:archaetidylinositol phosphate synthase
MAASNRVSHSLLDPWLTGPLKRLYPRLSLPRSLPPEAIIGCGHAAAAAGALGFALACQHPWAGLAGAAGVALNHTCDVLDGTHARSTGQCRNGGELLDHFVDPLSFSYWAAGLAYAAQGYSSWAPWLGVVGVIAIYAMAVLTSIRAKMIGEFTLKGQRSSKRCWCCLAWLRPLSEPGALRRQPLPRCSRLSTPGGS